MESNKLQCYFSRGHINALLVPESCGANGNSISADMIYDIIEND